MKQNWNENESNALNADIHTRQRYYNMSYARKKHNKKNKKKKGNVNDWQSTVAKRKEEKT